MKRFAAEVLFLDPSKVPRAVEALAAVDLEYEIDHDAIDPCGPTVFGMVTGNTELDEGDIAGWLQIIVGPFTGDVVEWGYGLPWKIRD
jgi:hypothetical protein